MFWLKIIQLITALLLIISILLQNKGSSLSGVFGGSDNVYMTKRGLDKTLFRASIILSAIFFAVSLAIILL